MINLFDIIDVNSNSVVIDEFYCSSDDGGYCELLVKKLNVELHGGYKYLVMIVSSPLVDAKVKDEREDIYFFDCSGESTVFHFINSNVKFIVLPYLSISLDKIIFRNSNFCRYFHLDCYYKVIRNMLFSIRRYNEPLDFKFKMISYLLSCSLKDTLNTISRKEHKGYELLSYIKCNISNPKLNISLIANDNHMSRSKVYRLLSDIGVNYTEFLKEYRINLLEDSICDNPHKCLKYHYDKTGYRSEKYIREQFKFSKGMTPSEFRRRLFDVQ